MSQCPIQLTTEDIPNKLWDGETKQHFVVTPESRAVIGMFIQDKINTLWAAWEKQQVEVFGNSQEYWTKKKFKTSITRARIFGVQKIGEGL